MKRFVEQCWVLHGMRLVQDTWIWRETHISDGSPGHVDFDWEKAWDDKMLVGWRHTHPGIDFTYPSTIDNNTMESWVKAAGRPMLCGITCGPLTMYHLYSLQDGQLSRDVLKWKSLGLAGAKIGWKGKSKAPAVQESIE